MAKSIPLGRVSDANDIGGAVTLLASDLAGFVTGQTLMCDGGASCTTLRPSLAPGEARPGGRALPFRSFLHSESENRGPIESNSRDGWV